VAVLEVAVLEVAGVDVDVSRKEMPAIRRNNVLKLSTQIIIAFLSQRIIFSSTTP
jgi:hypothetical protein